MGRRHVVCAVAELAGEPGAGYRPGVCARRACAGDVPKISDALRRGRISYSKVRAMTRVATPATEARLLHLAHQGTAAHLERIVRAWRLCDRQH